MIGEPTQYLVLITVTKLANEPLEEMSFSYFKGNTHSLGALLDESELPNLYSLALLLGFEEHDNDDVPPLEERPSRVWRPS